jgi:hypothetical protein
MILRLATINENRLVAISPLFSVNGSPIFMAVAHARQLTGTLKP